MNKFESYDMAKRSGGQGLVGRLLQSLAQFPEKRANKIGSGRYEY